MDDLCARQTGALASSELERQINAIDKMVLGNADHLAVLGRMRAVGQSAVAWIDAMRHRLGLDQPLIVQFGTWLWGVLRFDCGNSLWTGRPVVEELLVRLPLSLELALAATVVSVVIAIPFGMLAAVRQDTWVDYVIRVISIGGLAIPSFWVGILCILFLVIWFEIGRASCREGWWVW